MAVLPASSPATALTLLASDRRAVHVNLARTVPHDGVRRGAVVAAPRRHVRRRAEPGPAGPLVLEVRVEPAGTICEVWGPHSTPSEHVDQALTATAAWAGLHDTPGDLDLCVGAHPVLRELLRAHGPVRLSRLPRIGEAVGRAVLAQLVQGVEARRSTAQVASRFGTPAPGGLWAWPTAQQLGSTPAYALRRCGVSLRGAGALHAACVREVRLAEAVGSWPLLDARLRALPGIGAWTSGEVRLSLGDPDAVPVGDYHLPSMVGCVLGGPAARDSTRTDWDDERMLELLAPFTGQRGRVLRLCVWAVRRGLAPRPVRRGHRQPLSAHRYW